VGAVDERDMREGLWEVPEEELGVGVVLFGEEAEIVAHAQQALEQLCRFVLATIERERIDEPERARQEGAFSRWHAVEMPFGAISEQHAVPREVSLDGLDGAANARIIWREETDEGQKQQTGVQSRTAVGLCERAEVMVPGLVADLGVDVAADAAPPFDGSFAAELLTEFDPAVERHPRHHLGVREVPRLAAPFPHPMVRFAPALLELAEHVPAEFPDGQ